MSSSRLISRKVVLVGVAVAWAAVGSTTTVHKAVARNQGSRSTLDAELAVARLATAKYVNNLAAAKADGYGIITRMIPTMGYHYMNPKLKGFDVSKPPILVYEHRGTKWQLGAIEWVFPSKPKTPPLPGAKYGAFGAGCHYTDGTFVPEEAQSSCPAKAPRTGAAFNFWHPNLVTMHVWLWYPNPTGLYASTNPLVAPFDKG